MKKFIYKKIIICLALPKLSSSFTSNRSQFKN